MLHAQILDPAAIIQASQTIQAMREAADTAEALDAKAIKTLAKELATIKATMGEFATFHPCLESNRVLVAWKVGNGTIVRPLAGITGTIAKPVTLKRDSVEILRDLARKLHDHPALDKGDTLKIATTAPDGHARLCLALGTFKAGLVLLPSSFCDLPQSTDQPKTSISLDVKQLALAYGHVSKAIKPDKWRDWLQCVQVHIRPDLQQITLAASDGKRMHAAALRCDVAKHLPEIQLMFDNDDMATLLKLLGNLEQAQIQFGDNDLTIEADGQLLTFTQPKHLRYSAGEVAGLFNRALIDGESAAFSCEAKALQDSLKSSLLKADDGILSLRFDANGLNLSAGPCSVAAECEAIGRAVIGLQHKLLLECITQAKPQDRLSARVYQKQILMTFGHEVRCTALVLAQEKTACEVMEAAGQAPTCLELMFPSQGFNQPMAESMPLDGPQMAAEAPSNVIAFAPVARKKWLGASAMSIAMAV